MRAESSRPDKGPPKSVTWPSSGSIMCMIIRIVVDLPAPFGPSSPKTPPVGTSSDSAWTAVCPANRLVMRSA